MVVQALKGAGIDPQDIYKLFLESVPAFSGADNDVDVKTKEQIEQLKERVREMIVASVDKPSQKLRLIDAIERLGVAYHFESEITVALQGIYDTYHQDMPDDEEDLYTVALSFRLLRQHGHPISCDVFNNFKGKEGKFKETIGANVEGMLSLYEASHLSVHGEDILDEALNFTTTQLNYALETLTNDPVLIAQIVHALDQPIRRGLPRIQARRYISLYEQDDSVDKTLLDFAKLDFNCLQKLHQKELSELTRWWLDLDFANKLPFARDLIVETYLCWALSTYYEPQYSFTRKMMTKLSVLVAVMDDIYDIYGTIDELLLLTDAIQRLETEAMDQLPDYMKPFFQAFLDLYIMIDAEMENEGKSYATSYAKSDMKKTVRCYLTEAKWYHEGYVPTLEEYMSVRAYSTWYGAFVTTTFLGEGKLATKEVFDWATSFPLIVRAASVLSRLMDDVVTHKEEQRRGDVPSAVECYMKQHGATEDEAIVELQKRIADSWKDMNAEFLQPTAVPLPLLTRVLNYARVMHVYYRGEDRYSNSLQNGIITSVLIDPVPLE